jgi:hypothetical protein
MWSHLPVTLARYLLPFLPLLLLGTRAGAVPHRWQDWRRSANSLRRAAALMQWHFRGSSGSAITARAIAAASQFPDAASRQLH